MNPTLRAFRKEIPDQERDEKSGRRAIDLGEGSELVYVPRFLPPDRSWTLFDYLNEEIPWTRPTIRVFGRACLQVSLSAASIPAPLRRPASSCKPEQGPCLETRTF